MLTKLKNGLGKIFRLIPKISIDGQFVEILIIAFLLLFAGTVFYHSVEGWSVTDAFYFCVSTLTTVGFGDLVPTTEGSRLFTAIYILAGVGVLLGFVNAVAQHAKDRSPLDKLFKK